MTIPLPPQVGDLVRASLEYTRPDGSPATRVDEFIWASTDTTTRQGDWTFEILERPVDVAALQKENGLLRHALREVKNCTMGSCKVCRSVAGYSLKDEPDDGDPIPSHEPPAPLGFVRVMEGGKFAYGQSQARNRQEFGSNDANGGTLCAIVPWADDSEESRRGHSA